MAGAISVQFPSVPAAKPITEKGNAEFAALKHELSINSWEMSPNQWDKIQIIYTAFGKEQQAKCFLSAIELPQQEM